MMMGWGGDSTWLSVVGVVVGLAMLAAALWLIRTMFRQPRVEPHGPESPESHDSPGSHDSPESRAARGEMDEDQLRREQHDAGRRGTSR